MAVINKIRDNGWLLITLLGLALAGFILMDLVTNTQNYSSGDFNKMGEVNGEVIDREEYENYRALFGSGDPNQTNAQVWNFFVEQKLVNGLAENAGIGIQKDEMEDLQFGTNLSPIIQQRYADPNTRQIDPQMLTNIKANLASGNLPVEQKLMWRQQQNEIVKDRVQSKITALLSKSVYVPKWQAEMTFNEQNDRMDFLYVRVPFDKVPADAVSLTDADYQSFLDKNKMRYYVNEEMRVMDYVSIDVVPSSADSANTRKQLQDLVEGFRTAENDSAFVVQNEGEYDESYKLKSELPAVVAEDLFAQPVGSVVGPYLDGGIYSLVKILDRQRVPDSVRARHILINPSNEGGAGPALAKVDSLLEVLKNGQASFEQLAAIHGTDATKTKGGDLGYFTPTMMVKPFADMAFYKAKQGVPTKVATQFGFHIIEVTGKKFINNNDGAKVAIINRRIEPSKATQKMYEEKAIELVNKVENTEELAAAAKEMGLVVQQTQSLKQSDYFMQQLGSSQTVRNMVLWAFNEDTDKGDTHKDIFVISDESGYFDSKYVVAGLAKIIEKGPAKLENVKTSIEAAVMNMKKGDYLKGQIAAGSDLASVASKYGIAIDTAANAALQNFNLNNGGREAKVFGTAFRTEMNQVAGPIVGDNGVYLVKPINKPLTPAPPADLRMIASQAANQLQGRIRSGFMGSLKKSADIEDNRNNLGI